MQIHLAEVTINIVELKERKQEFIPLKVCQLYIKYTFVKGALKRNILKLN